jgi:acetyl/propionyl-CoA carboxylase alpha subunit
VFRTLRELGIGCVGIYSEADRGRAHVRAADEAYLVGPGPAAESYLRGDVLVETALRAGAQAIHPGYGFLAENAAFARMVEEAGLTWIGPPPDAIELMGTKTAARRVMRDAGATCLWQEAELIDEELVNRVHVAGGEVIAWTVDEPGVLDRLTRLGVDGLCGNYPDRIRIAIGPKAPFRADDRWI